MNANDLFRGRKSEAEFSSLIGMVFMGFVAGWVFLIPLAVAGLLIYGYIACSRDQKHMITVNYRTDEIVKAVALQKSELMGKHP